VAEHYVQTAQRGQGLVDVLDRILDKGLVIAGDIRINLANVELLTIRIRLLLCSIDKAEQIGIDWWRRDPGLTGPTYDGHEVTGLSARLDALAGRLDQLEQGGSSPER
jgi:Gas vesicle protein